MKNKPTFVSVVGWIYIIISGFFCLILFAQLGFFLTMFSDQSSAFSHGPTMPGGDFSFGSNNFYSNIYLSWILMTLACMAVLVFSILLLKRKAAGRWGVIIFNALLAGFILYNLVSSLTLIDSFAFSFNRGAFMFFRIFAVLISLLFSGLFIFIIVRLLSPGIAIEFKSPHDDNTVGSPEQNELKPDDISDDPEIDREEE